MQKKKRIYWLTNQVTPQVKALEDQLRHSGFHCDFFTNLDALMSAVAARRTTIVVVGDLNSVEKEVAALRYLAQRPELQGVRFILAPSRMHLGTMNQAASFNFRDILPLDLPPANWAERFVFATSSSPDPLPQPSAMIGLNQLATLHLPARVVWISRNQLWLESRLEAPFGTSLTLHGSLAEAVGLPGVKLDIIGTRNSFLFYRFSQASICNWAVPPKFRQSVQFVLRDLQASGVGPSCRIFMAVESPVLRNELIDCLPAPRFKVSAALQRNGIPIEPRYFSPAIVLIEDTLVSEGGSGGGRFAELMNSIEPHVPVLVLGEKFDLVKVRATFHHRPIYMLPQKADIVREAIKNRFAPNSIKHADFDQPDIVYLPPEHVLSFGEISIPARLSRLHPLQGSIYTGLPVGRYALAKIETPLLTRMFGRAVFAKLTSTSKEPSPDHALHPYVTEFAFSDLDFEQRSKLSGALPGFVADQMKAFAGPAEKQVGGPAVPESFLEPVPVPVPVPAKAARPWRGIRPKPVQPTTTELQTGFLQEFTDRIRVKWKQDRHFRLTMMMVIWMVGIVAGTYMLVTVYEPIGASTGKIWSDSFKAFRDRSSRRP